MTTRAAATRPGAQAERQAIRPTDQRYLASVARRLDRLHAFLDAHPVPTPEPDAAEWYHFLDEIKRLLGNFNHALSLSATLLVKAYLTTRHPDVEFDAAEKSHGAPGLDIDVTTRTAQRIVGAVQTVLPQHTHDFGNQQKSAFLRDAAKLTAALAEHKYLFLTAPEAFEVVCGRYRPRVPGIRVVSLSDGREFFDAPATRTARL